MLAPPPPPPYTLSPDLDDLSPEEVASLERSLAAVTGRLESVVVVAIAETGGVRVIDLATRDGQVMLLDSTEALLAE